ncbi:MAG: NERD domain-containing protein, partial [Taibaiella sp.]|nr:NERD domain-containing protein [Taibaiella sp.]
MIPEEGPVQNDSRTAEPDIYWRLAKQLPDDFTVIHSLPWLSAAAAEIDGRSVPTGELDFLLLHPHLGILAIEVKGGRLKYDRTRFIQVSTNEFFDPVTQVRRGTHGLAKWIKGSGGPAFKIGYALAFPEADMQERQIPPALADYSGENSENICIDRNNLRDFGKRVTSIMQFWKTHLKTRDLAPSEIDQIVDLICPRDDYSPFWTSRIEYDKKTWLALTKDQTKCLKKAQESNRYVITGRSGTGKTVIALAYAKQLAEEKKSVLFLVY